jgi:small subunit ribosomal protein S27Ae
MADKPKKPRKTYKIYKIYEIKGSSITRKNKLCPKCNVFMGMHKNRMTCGKCGYTEMI